MNMVWRELKANRRSLIIWCASMAVGVLAGMAKYTAFSAGDASTEMLNALPKTIRALFGMGSLNVTTMAGFFAFLFLYIAVALGIHAAILGSGIIAKEERDKTSEFLMVRPVSRTAVITAKLFAAFLNIVILNTVTLLSSVVMVSKYNKGESITREILLFFVSLFFIQAIFMTLGAFIGAALKNVKSAVSLTVGVLLAAFTVTEITNIAEDLSFLKILSPFSFFSYERIVAGDGLSAIVAVLSLLIIAVLAALTYRFYNKRDFSS